MKNTQKEIERQEQELKDLLHRVMQAPLGPLSQSVTGLDERIEQVEKTVQELRDVDLASIGLVANESRKQISALRTLTEDTPREVQKTIASLLDKSLMDLVQQQQRALSDVQQELQKFLTDGHVHQSTAFAALGDRLQALSDSTSSQVQALSGGLDEMRIAQNAQQISLKLIPLKIDNLPGELTPKLSQVQEQQGIFAELQQELHDRVLKELTFQSTTLLEALKSRLQSLSDSVELQVKAVSGGLGELRSLQNEQKNSLKAIPDQINNLPTKWLPKLEQLDIQQTNLEKMLQLHTQISNNLTVKMVSLHRWLFWAVVLGGLSLAGVAALAVRIWS